MNPLAENIVSKQQSTWIEIRADHLIHNLREAKRLAGERQAVLAVIKANAYGHGLEQAAQILAQETDFFGVSSIHEALALDALELGKEILVFGRFFPEELPSLLRPGISLSVSSLDEAKDISRLSKAAGLQTRIHIKVDTGMGRMGIPLREAESVIQQIVPLSNLIPEGLYTHFPTAETADDFAARQSADFSMLIQKLEARGIRFRWRHAQNSAATLLFRSGSFNMIRPGLMLYGIYPSPSLRDLADLKPVLSLKSKIHFIKPLRAGESAGYGRTFIADRATRLGILPIGYSNGYPWSASGKSFVLIDGKRFPIAGRVSMDYVAIHLGDADIREGAEVTLLGASGSDRITAEELAGWAGTLSYEIVTQLSPQLPRLITAS